ncbi:MAG: class I SAM-dependent methyltransferase [Bacteroidota bacterium]
MKSDEMAARQRQVWDGFAKQNALHFIGTTRNNWTDEEFFQSSLQWFDGKTIRDLFESILELGHGHRCLDVGCGAGRMVPILRQYFEEYYGLDIAPEMLKKAEEYKKKMCWDNVYFALVGPNTLGFPFEGGYFDFIWSYIVFRHFNNFEMVRKYFAEVARCLKPSGKFFIEVKTFDGIIKILNGNLMVGFGFPRTNRLRRILPFLKRRPKVIFHKCDEFEWGIIITKKTARQICAQNGLNTNALLTYEQTDGLMIVGKKP